MRNTKKLYIWNKEELLTNCNDLQLKLSDLRDSNNTDIDSQSLFEELKSFEKFVKENFSMLHTINFSYKNNLIDTFPNIVLQVIRIYFSLSETTFSKLKLTKNYLCSTMSQECLMDM